MEKDAGGRIRRIHCCTISHFPHCDFPPCVSCQHTVALHWTHSLQQAKDREILICSAQWTENGILLNLYSGTHSWIPFLCFQGNYSLRVALEPTKIALSDANKSKAVQMMHLERFSMTDSQSLFGFPYILHFEKCIYWKVNYSDWVGCNILLFLGQIAKVMFGIFD